MVRCHWQFGILRSADRVFCQQTHQQNRFSGGGMHFPIDTRQCFHWLEQPDDIGIDQHKLADRDDASRNIECAAPQNPDYHAAEYKSSEYAVINTLAESYFPVLIILSFSFSLSCSMMPARKFAWWTWIHIDDGIKPVDPRGGAAFHGIFSCRPYADRRTGLTDIHICKTRRSTPLQSMDRPCRR